MTDARDGDDVDAQAEYDADDVDAGHRQRVHEAADRALDKDADLIQRLRDDDGNDGAAWVDRLRSGSRLRDVTDGDGEGVSDGPAAV